MILKSIFMQFNSWILVAQGSLFLKPFKMSWAEHNMDESRGKSQRHWTQNTKHSLFMLPTWGWHMSLWKMELLGDTNSVEISTQLKLQFLSAGRILCWLVIIITLVTKSTELFSDRWWWSVHRRLLYFWSLASEAIYRTGLSCLVFTKLAEAAMGKSLKVKSTS